MSRKSLAVAVSAVALGVGGLGAGLGLSLRTSQGAAAQGLAPASAKASYAFYLSVARRYAVGQGGGYGPMMGGSGYSWMLGRSGYTWMMGSTGAPGWMMGGSLPSSVMGTSRDPGKVMGRVFANAPGPRLSARKAAKLATAVPSGAVVDRSANRITFKGQTVDFAVVASPSMPDEDFRIAGLTDPTVVVAAGADVQVEFVNADSDMAHGLVIAEQGAVSSFMPMMTARPVFAGASLWFLGDATSAGMHVGMLDFTSSAAGTYSYICPIPGHAQEGMAGTFVVRPGARYRGTAFVHGLDHHTRALAIPRPNWDYAAMLPTFARLEPAH